MKKWSLGVVLALTISSVVQAATLTADSVTGIQSVMEAAVNGDIIEVQPGYYTENIDFLNKAVELVAVAGPGQTIIDGNGATTVKIQGLATIRGFTITGGYASFGAGMEVKGSGTLIEGNVFTGNQQGAGGYGAAIGGNAASPIIDGNIFRDNSSDMQFLSGVVSFINGSQPVISNNIFENNQSRAINLSLPTGNKALVVNNTLVGNATGIYVDRRVNAGAIEIRNNIVVGNDAGLHMQFGSDENNPLITHNLFWNNLVNYFDLADQTGLNGNLIADPLFINNQYQISKDSPAIDAGTDVNAPDHDFRGVARPRDGDKDGVAITDIGAQEGGSVGLGLLVLGWLGFFRRLLQAPSSRSLVLTFISNWPYILVPRRSRPQPQ